MAKKKVSALDKAEQEAQEAAKKSDVNPNVVPEEKAPRLSDEEAKAAEVGSEDEGEAKDDVGTPDGETDPDSVPTIQRESTSADDLAKGGQPPQFDPNRAASEGEVAANVAILEAKGDTAPVHPSYNADARTVTPADSKAKEGEQEYYLIGNIGAFRPAKSGQPMKVVTQKQLMIPDTSLARHLKNGVLVPK